MSHSHNSENVNRFLNGKKKGKKKRKKKRRRLQKINFIVQNVTRNRHEIEGQKNQIFCPREKEKQNNEKQRKNKEKQRTTLKNNEKQRKTGKISENRENKQKQ